jgi:hypothetical protein
VLDASVDLLVSVDGRRPSAEARRVLRAEGVFLVAVPGAGDLAELRAAVLADARPLAGLERVAAELAADFELCERRAASETHALDAALVQDLARATYRAGRRSESERLQAAGPLRVTVAHDVGLFRPLRRAPPPAGGA